MQQAPARKRGRPRKNPLPYEDEVVPVVEQVAETPAIVEGISPNGNEVFTAVGIRPCANSRWIVANLNGVAIQVKILKSRKTPKNQPFKVKHLVGSQYEEIR